MSIGLSNNRLAHISDITAEYQVLQLDVIEKQRRWQANQTAGNLTDLINAMEKLDGAPIQQYLPGLEDSTSAALINAIRKEQHLEPCS